MVTSGIRIGTPAVTTRGMKEPEMEKIATCITDKLKNPTDDATHQKVLKSVGELCKAFPLYKERLAGVR
jgi:glycine hydroxymethyltransferase